MVEAFLNPEEQEDEKKDSSAPRAGSKLSKEASKKSMEDVKEPVEIDHYVIHESKLAHVG